MGKLYGGYGQHAFGRAQYGAATSEIEPRFSYSNPVDGAENIPQGQFVTFETYYYSSHPDIIDHAHWGLCPNIKLEVSVDGGSNFETIFDPENMLDDAPGYTVRVRVKDGQTVWGLIESNTGWPFLQEVIFRYTGMDEFGNESTKETPVYWP